MRLFLASLHISNSPPAIASSQSSIPSQRSKHKISIPGGELLEGLLVVGVVGIDVAGEPAGGDRESGALDGCSEGSPRGLAGEGSDARARRAADEGGDRHGGGVVGGAERRDGMW